MNAQFRRELQVTARALARALHDDPLYTYVLPDAGLRAHVLPALMHGTLKHCVRHGGVEAAPDGCGGLGWVNGEHMELGLVDLVRAGMWTTRMRLGTDAYARLEAHGRACEQLITQITRRVFAYVWVLGIAPGCQREGMGTDLLRGAFRIMEALGMELCLFKTESPLMRPFFERLGFTTVHASKVHASGLEVWVMQRFLRQRRRVGLPDPADALRRPRGRGWGQQQQQQ